MRQIIVNGEDYGEFNEAYLRTFCAGYFVDTIKKIHNQINDIECSEVYKEYVTNATTLDFEDCIPSSGQSGVIYIQLSNNDNFDCYLWLSDAMIKIGKINLADQFSITEVPQLPQNPDQKIIYKVKGTEALFWWNGTEYANISSESAMIPVNTFPTGVDIKQGQLYKLLKDISHYGELKYIMLELQYTEGPSSSIPQSGYYHDTTNDLWYCDGESITIEDDQTLPEPTDSVVNKYYLIGGDLLYQCRYTRPVIVDYYSGIYAYMNNDWRSLYTSNLMVGYNTGIVQSSLPIINNKRVIGSHGIDYYGGVTKSQADGTYQGKEMENPIEGFIATDIEGSMHELNNKVSFNVRVKDSIPTNADLNNIQNPDIGDAYVVKVDTAEVEERNNIIWAWNGTKWFEYGEAGTDMSKYQKFVQKINSLKTANPDITFSENSSLAQTDVFTLAKVEGTLQTPITDLQSPDRVLLNLPNDINITDGEINVKVLTHAGQYTATENISELPQPKDIPYHREFIMGFPTKDQQNSGDNFITEVYRMRKIKPYESSGSLVGTGYEHFEHKYYLDGVEITNITIVQTIPESTEENVGNYYVTSMDDTTLCLSSHDFGATQQVSYITGEFLYKTNGDPLLYGEQALEVWMTEPKQYYVLDDRDVLEDDDNYVIGYETKDITINGESKRLSLPIYKLQLKTFQMNENYILYCLRKDSHLGINNEGVVGTYEVQESKDSLKYCNHAICKYGLDGTYSFIPKENSQDKLPLRESYIQGRAIKIPGNITVDKFFIDGLLK